MKKRGKVLRDTISGPGLLMIEGQQYRFSSQGVWQSETPPKQGLVVDVEVDTQGVIHSVTVVSGSQLAREQAEGETTGSRLPLAAFGIHTLTAAGVLLTSWFFLTTASIQLPYSGTMEFTFWQLLGFLRGGNAERLLEGRDGVGAGLYGLIAISAMTGPFVHFFWKDRRTLLGGFLPLFFMLIAGIAVRNGLRAALVADHINQAGNDVMNAVSIGFGAYVSMIAGLYLVFRSSKDFQANKSSTRQKQESSQRRAA